MKALQLKLLLLVQLVATLISVVKAQSSIRAAAKKEKEPERTIQELKDFRNNLQELPCNERYPAVVMRTKTISATLTEIFSTKVSKHKVQDANQILNNYIPMIEHDVQIMKVST